MTDFIHYTSILKRSVQKTYWGELESMFINVYNQCNDAAQAYQQCWEKYVNG